jgi:hypothetical protein
MQTMKLRAYQRPSGLELLLDSLVTSQNWVSADAPHVADRSELSSALQRLAIQASKGEGTWRAWVSHDGVRLFVTEMSMALSRERGCPALNVRYYNDQARLQSYTMWVQSTDGAWQRCAL